jgi:hypothetical protein
MPRRVFILALSCLIGGVALGALATGGNADLAPISVEPAHPMKVPTQPATAAEAGAAKLGSSAMAAKGGGRVTLKARISQRPIRTEPRKSNFVGLDCPKGYVAMSGGALTGFANLLMSQSVPINPQNGKYTPRTWWVSVTNSDLDGSHETLPWRPLVNCLKPIKLG